MMRAGKDYIAKGNEEYEGPHAKYLRELLQAVGPQPDPVVPKVQEQSASARANQDRPTLKIDK